MADAPATKPATPTVSPTGSAPQKMAGTPPFSMSKPSTSEGRWLNLMCYAKPGVGKTTLIGTAADIDEMQDVLLIDAESGTLAIEENDRIKHPERIMENHIRVTEFKQVAKIHEYLKAHCKWRDENNEEMLRKIEAQIRGCQPSDIIKPKKYRTVLIDSLTEIDIYCTYGLLGINQNNVLHGESDDIEVARFDEFRKNNQMMQMLVRAFRDLPMHVLAACGAKYNQDELKKMFWTPALTGQLATQVPGFFDIVGFMQAAKNGDKVERRMYVKPVSNFEAKNRRSVFKADYFDDPTMTTIMKGIGLLK